MRAPGILLDSAENPALCPRCGAPVDSEYFDESGLADAPEPGRRVVLARFELRPQHCGVLEYIAQFTDLFACDCKQIETPGIEWAILENNRPLYPYLGLRWILNPWGYGSFPVAIRLSENAVVEFVVRGIGSVAGEPKVAKVGGRILGRFWYNPEYGHAASGPCHFK